MLDINGEQSRWVTCLQRLQSDNYWALKSSSPWIDLSTSHGQSLAHPWLWCTGILFSGVWISLVLNLCRFEGPEPISVHMLLNACANCLQPLLAGQFHIRNAELSTVLNKLQHIPTASVSFWIYEFIWYVMFDSRYDSTSCVIQFNSLINPVMIMSVIWGNLC